MSVLLSLTVKACVRMYPLLCGSRMYPYVSVCFQRRAALAAQACAAEAGHVMSHDSRMCVGSIPYVQPNGATSAAMRPY